MNTIKLFTPFVLACCLALSAGTVTPDTAQGAFVSQDKIQQMVDKDIESESDKTPANGAGKPEQLVSKYKSPPKKVNYGAVSVILSLLGLILARNFVSSRFHRFCRACGYSGSMKLLISPDMDTIDKSVAVLSRIVPGLRPPHTEHPKYKCPFCKKHDFTIPLSAKLAENSLKKRFTIRRS